MIEGLSESAKKTLLDFMSTPYYKAYREYVLYNSGVCLGSLRNPNVDRDTDQYVKGRLSGLEDLTLSLLQEVSSQGDAGMEKAARESAVYTEELLTKKTE